MIVAVALGAALSVATLGAACARRGSQPADEIVTTANDSMDAPVREDSVRGVVHVVGAEPGYLSLRPGSGGAMDLMGEDLAALRSADGLEVALFGQFGPPSGVTMSTAGFVITRFAVRAADGDAAIDGVLERSGEGFVLRLADGARLPLASVPEPLRTATGMRIFWVGPLDSAPRAYGVLGAARAPY